MSSAPKPGHQNGPEHPLLLAPAASDAAGTVPIDPVRRGPGGDGFLCYYLLLNSDSKPTCLSWFCSPQSAAAAPSPVLGNIPPNDGMPGGPIPPGFFQVGCRSSRRPRRRGARVCSRLAVLSPRGPRPSSMPTQRTRLGITRGLPSSHLRFLVSVARKPFCFLLAEVSVYLQSMFFPKLLVLCLG